MNISKLLESYYRRKGVLTKCHVFFAWLLLSSSFGSVCTRAAVVFSDGNFQASDWEVVSEGWGNGGSVSSEIRQIGGNPGAFMRILTTVNAAPPYSAVQGTFLRENAIYDPAEHGAIQAIDYSESSIMLSGWGQGQATGLAIQQNGRIYYAGVSPSYVGRGYANSSWWIENSFTGLTAADFGRAYDFSDDHPDFSAKGSPLQFGFYRGNSTPSFSYSIDGGIDNWSVTIHSRQSVSLIGI